MAILYDIKYFMSKDRLGYSSLYYSVCVVSSIDKTSTDIPFWFAWSIYVVSIWRIKLVIKQTFPWQTLLIYDNKLIYSLDAFSRPRMILNVKSAYQTLILAVKIFYIIFAIIDFIIYFIYSYNLMVSFYSADTHFLLIPKLLRHIPAEH